MFQYRMVIISYFNKLFCKRLHKTQDIKNID